jgi:hypothetical protein
MFGTIAFAIVLALAGCERSGTAHTPDVATPPHSTAAPVATVESPRRDLSVDEDMGGHTLARHVGKTDAELRERLRREPNISTASTYTDRAAVGQRYLPPRGRSTPGSAGQAAGRTSS